MDTTALFGDERKRTHGNAFAVAPQGETPSRRTVPVMETAKI